MTKSRSQLVIGVTILFIIGVIGVLAEQQKATPLVTALPAASVQPTEFVSVATITPGLTPQASPSEMPLLTSTVIAALTLMPADLATVAPTVTVVPATLTPTPAEPTVTVTPGLSIMPCAGVAPVAYTISLSEAAARDKPDVLAQQVQPLTRGQPYAVCAQSADGIWVRLDSSGAKTEWWAPVGWGVLQGDAAALPVAGPTPKPRAGSATPTATLAGTPVSAAYLPTVSARARAVYRYGLKLGNQPTVFAKIGDCQATTPYFMAAFDNRTRYRLGGQYAYLQETIKQFAGAFARDSVAAKTGFGAAAVLDPQWTAANAQCKPGETPLACEYRLNRPSIAFISLGTNDIWQPAAAYEKDLRMMIEYSIQRGVLPILGTKADNMEGDGHLNRTVVMLAQEYDLPLWDFWQVAQGLPNTGLADEYHLTWGQSMFDDPALMQLGWPWRNLTGLQALDAVWRAVR